MLAAVEEREAPPLGLSKRALFVEGETAAGAAWMGLADPCAECKAANGSRSGSVTGRLRDGGGWRGSWRAEWSEMVLELKTLPNCSGTRR